LIDDGIHIGKIAVPSRSAQPSSRSAMVMPWIMASSVIYPPGLGLPGTQDRNLLSTI
jgi:hypothetical protein